MIQIFKNATNLYCKKNKSNNYLYKNGNVWWKNMIEKEIKLRNKLRKKLSRNKCSINVENYRKQRNKVKNMIHHFKKEYWDKVNSGKTINELFKSVKSLKHKKNNIDGVINMANKKIFNLQSIVDTIGSYFVNISEILSNENNVGSKNKNIYRKIILKNIKTNINLKKSDQKFSISINEIFNEIKYLNPKKKFWD